MSGPRVSGRRDRGNRGPCGGVLTSKARLGGVRDDCALHAAFSDVPARRRSRARAGGRPGGVQRHPGRAPRAARYGDRDRAARRRDARATDGDSIADRNRPARSDRDSHAAPERNLDSHADGDGYSGCANANANADCGCHGGRDAIAHDLPLQPPRHDRRGGGGRELRLPDDGRGRDERVRQPRCGAGGQRRAAHPSSGRKRNIPRGLLRHGEGR